MTTCTFTESAELANLLARVTEVLLDAHVDGGSTENIRFRLRTFASHSTRLDVVPQEEPFDGSISHDVLIRRVGAPTVSVGVAGSANLPWPLRAMVRARDRNVVRVNGTTITV